MDTVQNETDPQDRCNDEVDKSSSAQATNADTVDIRRRYSCFYCGFSVEKYKYIKSHIKRFHIIDATSYTEKCLPQVHIQVEPTLLQENSNSEEATQRDRMDLDIPAPLKEVHAPTPIHPQSKPFNMDLCPYCDFSDKIEKRLRHHILSKHSKELDKIILYESDKKDKTQNKCTKAKDSNQSKDNTVIQEQSFKESIKTPYSIAQMESSQNSMTEGNSLKPHASDKNQNNILPFTQTLSTGSISLNFLDNSSSESKDDHYFKCTQCDFQSTQSWDFLLHTMQNHPSSDHNQFYDSGYSSYQGHYEFDKKLYEMPQEGLYSCIHCHYTTPRLQLLNRHMMSKHSDRRPHKCAHCDYATKRLEHLNRHILCKHSGQKPYQCEYCDYRAARDDHLRNHVLSKHSQETLLRCTNCNYSAISLEQLNSHMATRHSNLKNHYTCQLCSYSSSKEEHLNRHMVARHSDMTMYSCDQCNYSTSSPENLNRHMLSHTMVLPYQCKFCDFGCSKSEDLNTHLISAHKNGRPHVCPECDYRATRLGHLTRHIQTRHTGMKPYRCTQCEYQAGRVEHLQRHILNKHSDNQAYTCRACDYTTFREDLLNNHFLSKHVEQGYLTTQFCDIAIKLEEDSELQEKLPKEEPSSCPEPNNIL